MRSGRGQARCIIHGTVAALDSGPAHIIHQENQEQLDVFSRLSSTSLKSERDDPRRVSPALSLNQAENQHTWAQPGLVAYIALEPTGNISQRICIKSASLSALLCVSSLILGQIIALLRQFEFRYWEKLSVYIVYCPFTVCGQWHQGGGRGRGCSAGGHS